MSEIRITVDWQRWGYYFASCNAGPTSQGDTIAEAIGGVILKLRDEEKLAEPVKLNIVIHDYSSRRPGPT